MLNLNHLRSGFSIVCCSFLLIKLSAQIAPAPGEFACDQTIFSESFESGIPAGWTDIALDAFKTGTSFNQGWVIDRDTTFTANVGPDMAQDGDFYVYCDGSGPIGRGAVATMTSPVINIPDVNVPALTFYLNMNGQSGSFMVNILEGTTSTNVISPVNGDVPGGIHAGDEWEQLYVDLTPWIGKDIQIEFGGTKPAAPTSVPREGDIAIDNITICSSVVTVPTLGEWSLIILGLITMILGVLSLKLRSPMRAF